MGLDAMSFQNLYTSSANCLFLQSNFKLMKLHCIWILHSVRFGMSCNVNIFGLHPDNVGFPPKLNISACLGIGRIIGILLLLRSTLFKEDGHGCIQDFTFSIPFCFRCSDISDFKFLNQRKSNTFNRLSSRFK